MSTPADPLSLQRALGGNYRVLRLLGRGGMGAVYLARDETLDRLVAIKVISSHAPDHAAGPERFRREARTAARLNHPNIVPLHAFGEAEGTLYFAMGYVRGESLGERLRREGKVSIDEGLRILAEVADALDHAHRQGVIHRDVKPDNILLDDESGRALLTDFGVAKTASGATLTGDGGIVGTPHYMSPEQISGQAVDGRSDIYALGVVAYAALAGRLPFEGGSARELLLQHVQKDAPAMKDLEPAIPDEVAAAFRRCLAKDPAARWPDAGQLRDVLAPGARDEAEMPIALASMEGIGSRLVPWAIALVYGLWLERLWNLGPTAASPLHFLLALLALLPVRDVGRGMAARKRGFSWAVIARAAFGQPRWWPAWYPPRLRHAADVWDRLPAMTRRLRTLLALITAIGIAEVLLVFALLGVGGQPVAADARREWMITGLTTTVIWALPVGLVLGLAWYNLGKSWAIRRGLDAIDGYRLLLEPTAGSRFWKRPHIARLLSAAGARGTPRSAAEYVAAIEGAARGLAEDASQAASALARDLSRRVTDMDREIARLRRDADPVEAQRLDERLAALGPESANEPPGRRQLRNLLQQQRALAESLGTQLAAAEDRRSDVMGLLGRLWDGVSRLTQERPVERESAADALRVLCAEISRHMPPDAAAAELEALPTRELPAPGAIRDESPQPPGRLGPGT